jgi:large subunit ribosomal protein L19
VHPTVREFEAARVRRDRVDFRPGDTIRVSVRIVEGEKERVQDFEGVCMNRRGSGMGETFTVRRISYGVGMERIFPVSSPRIEDIRVVRRGKVRRAHLTYLKALRGKKARITEDLLRSQRIARDAKEASAAAAAAADASAAQPTA